MQNGTIPLDTGKAKAEGEDKSKRVGGVWRYGFPCHTRSIKYTRETLEAHSQDREKRR